MGDTRLQQQWPDRLCGEKAKARFLSQWPKLYHHDQRLLGRHCGFPVDARGVLLRHTNAPARVALPSRMALRKHSRVLQCGAASLSPASARSSKLPALSASASLTLPGRIGAAPDPLPGAPPELNLIIGPTSVMPPASSLIKLPAALKVSSLPASRTTFWPLDRWISWPALINWPVPILMCWLLPTVRWSEAQTSLLRSACVVRCSSALNSL